MVAALEYRCEVCGGLLLNLDADCPKCGDAQTEAQEFTDLSAGQFIQRFEREPLPDSFYALARNAIAGENFEAASNVGPVSITSAGQTLERDGCDYIRAAFLILEHLDCPPNVRDFVLCLAGLTGGDGDKWFKSTDQQIAEHMGFTAGHIGTKRRELIAWEQRRNMAVVEIKKGDLDRSVMRYNPTEYRVPVVGIAALFIRRVRSLPARQAQAPAAFKDEVKRGYKEIALELCEDGLSEVPIAKDRKQRKVKNIGSSVDRLGEQRQKLLRLVSEYCEAAGRMGHNVPQLWNEIDSEVRELLAGRVDDS